MRRTDDKPVLIDLSGWIDDCAKPSEGRWNRPIAAPQSSHLRPTVCAVTLLASRTLNAVSCARSNGPLCKAAMIRPITGAQPDEAAVHPATATAGALELFGYPRQPAACIVRISRGRFANASTMPGSNSRPAFSMRLRSPSRGSAPAGMRDEWSLHRMHLKHE